MENGMGKIVSVWYTSCFRKTAWMDLLIPTDFTSEN